MINYNPYKLTALNRSSLSAPMNYLLTNDLLKGKILDFGCGNGQDVDKLKLIVDIYIIFV